MAEHPLKILETVDPALFKAVKESNTFALSDGALPKKVKLLIALALDAAHGADAGVKSLTQQALQAGATKEEVMEAVRVAGYICGVGSVYTAAAAFREIF
jgi:alkylhydroperoxidase/carboxymuconolactone decarboxylase family protein YurZ